MAWPASGMALATMVARVTALLVMVSLAPALATMAARVTALPAFVMVSMAPALSLLLLPLALPALVLAGTRARRLEQLKTRRRHEASGLVRGQQLPRLQGAVAAAAA